LNPGAVVNESNKTITVNSKKNKTDLNGIANVDAQTFDKVISSFAILQKKLIHNKGTKQINSTNHMDYLKHIFADVTEGENVKVDYVVTVSKYESSINNPIKKFGFDSEKTLKSGDLFVNISAKLTFNGKTHYVTLATLSKLDKLAEKSKEFDPNIADVVTTKFKEYEATLKGKTTMLELDVDLDSLEFNTGTVFAKEPSDSSKKINEKHALTKLRENFPGLNFSEIRMYPGSEEEFFQLLRRYTFGKERFSDNTEETKARKAAYFEALKNKPYIVVSYDTNLNGDPNSLKTIATLVPIVSESRKLSTLISEVESVLKERDQSIRTLSKNKQDVKISPELNAKTEVLLSRPDILEILIT